MTSKDKIDTNEIFINSVKGKHQSFNKLANVLNQTPKWLVLGVNNICNLHCKMCDVGPKNDETVFSKKPTGTKPLDMPLNLFEMIAIQAKIYFPKIKLGDAFTELLIYRYLEQNLEITKRFALDTAITTNGLKLKEKANAIVEHGVKDLFLSLDGVEDVHNYIRKHKYSFQKNVSGIEEILRYTHRPSLSVYCVITEWNIGRLAKFADFFTRIPLNQLGFMHTKFTTQQVAQHHNLQHGLKYFATHSNIGEVNVNNMNLELLWSEISRIKKISTRFLIKFSQGISSLDLLNVFSHQPHVMFVKNCSDVYKNIMFKSGGTVIPAHGRCFNLRIGNIYQHGLNEIWESQVLNSLRDDLAEAGGLFPACSRCCSAFG